MKHISLKLPLAIAVIGAALVFSANGRWPWARLSEVSTTEPILVTSSYRIVSDTLRRGENVAALLNRQGVTGLNLRAIAAAISLDTKRIKAGLVFLVHRDGVTDEATHVEFRPNPDQRVQFIHTAAGWTGQTVPVRWTTDTIRVSCEISTSLYGCFDREIGEAMLDQGERRRMVDALTDVYGDVDFTVGLRRGDRIATLIERRTSEENETAFGQILASDFTISGTEHQAFRFASLGEKGSFYDETGRALKRAFLAVPLKYKYYISSGFSLSRFHPILGLMRKHEGTDFAAAKGTPINATGDGVVSVAGWSGGYGNLVEIHHAGGIVTRYGHMSRVLVHVGQHVAQGDVIGLVGSTGLATGPHVHYEFRVNGVARDPGSVRNDAGPPLTSAQLAQFMPYRDALLQLLGPLVKGRAATVTE